MKNTDATQLQGGQINPPEASFYYKLYSHILYLSGAEKTDQPGKW